MNTHTATWDEVRQIADELELKIHVAGMDARDRWQTLRPFTRRCAAMGT